ncbi:hypothetical protein GDO86_019561 [Hymenochirus boettgeri]|uniref:ZIC1-5/GLI1-3like C2H2 zinc finger domain-containing protein n=1 Tax=Hymenochirus boettgeri TaxID=247094 RepID=A0A8T2ICG3_9PIPI|nr:hypothetical protein GDO86_019561 [Hymenochirus boettgeri]
MFHLSTFRCKHRSSNYDQTSPNSWCIYYSRCSSASGSYGHLSIGTISCTKEFDTQEHLVHKEFVCHWQDCSRELRPFKAQYMLGVHMKGTQAKNRTKCTFEGCNKAYSRLENLKTHLGLTLGKSLTNHFVQDSWLHQALIQIYSLRKHVKTVHAPEAHITKKLVGMGCRGQSGHEGTGSQCIKGMKCQASPGGQSSCSSERSPLGSANNNDSGVEMNANTGGSFEDLTNLDDNPSVESMGTASASALRKLENLRIDKLNQLRKTPSSGKTVKLPSINNPGPQGDLSVICGQLGMPHNQHVMELSSNSHINQLNDRRNSTTSTMSSAYTVSRRSSVVSPYLSNQRTVENGNMVDSFDRIPSDSGQSNDAVCTSGLPGLTPAQQYRLKAKYAAATVGPPPTPLPNMDRMMTNNRMSFATSDYRGSSISSLLAGNTQRRHSNNEYHNYGTGILHPAQAPGAGMRRASDPARTGGDPQSVPRVQRFKSMTNMNISMMGRQGVGLQQAYGGSEANLQRHMFSPRPPSISENIFMETHDSNVESHNKEQNMVSSNEMQQYMNYQGQGSQLALHTDQMNYNHQVPGLDNQNQIVYPNTQRGISNMHLNSENQSGQSNVLTHANFNQCQMSTHNQHLQNTRQMASCANLPIQWNEVKLWNYNTPRVQSQNQEIILQNAQHGNHDNMTAQSLLSTSLNSNMLSPQGRRTQTPMMQVKEMMVRNYVQSQQALMWEQHPKNMEMVTNSGEDVDTGQNQHSNTSNASPKKNSCVATNSPQSDTSNNTSMMYYSGQGEIHHGKVGPHKLTPPLNHNQASCDGHQHGQYNSNHSFLKTDSLPYTGSCPVPNPLDSLDLENTQIDFAAIIDDPDHSSLMPENTRHSGLTGLSQDTSHLSTLRNPSSVVPNMAVGDLNSMLTSLAGENKFLNTIS